MFCWRLILHFIQFASYAHILQWCSHYIIINGKAFPIKMGSAVEHKAPSNICITYKTLCYENLEISNYAVKISHSNNFFYLRITLNLWTFPHASLTFKFKHQTPWLTKKSVEWCLNSMCQMFCMQGDFSFDDITWKTISSSAKGLISRLLSVEPYKRPSAEEVWLVLHQHC